MLARWRSTCSFLCYAVCMYVHDLGCVRGSSSGIGLGRGTQLPWRQGAVSRAMWCALAVLWTVGVLGCSGASRRQRAMRPGAYPGVAKEGEGANPPQASRAKRLGEGADGRVPVARSVLAVEEPLPLTELERRNIFVFRRVKPAVVNITRLKVRRSLLHMDVLAIPAGTGSGIVWDDDGHIVTNLHVIKGADAAKVTFADHSVHHAKFVGGHADKDIAVLHIESAPEGLRPIALGASHDLQVGQSVLAVGNPFGLDHTLSTGVVSGLGREIKGLSGRPIQGAIQTDAAINPGNSGGPLLDSGGRLIGINTMIYSRSGAATGIGFAVPVNTVKRVVQQLIAHGQVMRAGLGIEVDETGFARSAGVRGVLLIGIHPKSEAERAGLIPTRTDKKTGYLVLGDVLVSVDGKKVSDANDLFRILDLRKVGDEVELQISRDGKTFRQSLRLQAVSRGH